MGITRGWSYKVNIKQFLSDDDSEEGVLRIRSLIADELQKAGPFTKSFHDQEGWHLQDELRDVETADDFNYLLAAIYDYSDAYRIWLGI